MKYINTILVIICGVTLATLYFVWPEKSVDTTNVEVTSTKNGYHTEEYAGLLASPFTCELLIQEAQQQDHTNR